MRWTRLARWRLENEVKGSMYREKDETRKCREYECEEDSCTHVWDNCLRENEDIGGWEGNVKKDLGKEGLREE